MVLYFATTVWLSYTETSEWVTSKTCRCSSFGAQIELLRKDYKEFAESDLQM